MKILITGAYGMLGSDLRDVLSSHDVIAAGSKDLDITDREKVLEFVKENFPDIVINAAAYTAVDDCETNFDEAYQVNAIGPRNLAIACREIDSPLVHISTDYVFDGSKKTPLRALTERPSLKGRSSLKRYWINISFSGQPGSTALTALIS